jgi:hypothetical protein
LIPDLALKHPNGLLVYLCTVQVPVSNTTISQVRRAFQTTLGSQDSVCIPLGKPHLITASCPENELEKIIDRIGLHTRAVFISHGTQSKQVYKCRLCDKPDRKHGPAPAHKTTLFTPRTNNSTSVMCGCKAKIYVTLKDGEAHLYMHLTHTGHTPNTASDLRNLPLRREVMQKLVEVATYTQFYPAIKRRVASWVNEELKPNLGLPKDVLKKKQLSEKGQGSVPSVQGTNAGFPMSKPKAMRVFVDRRFNPTSSDIKNVLQGRAGVDRLSDIDQEDTIKQLCSDPELTWVFRPHAGGHVTHMFIPNSGLYQLAMHADLNMHSTCVAQYWDVDSFQTAMCGFLEQSVESANRKVGHILFVSCRHTCMYLRCCCGVVICGVVVV